MQPATTTPSRVPQCLQYPLLVILSMSLSFGLLILTAEYTSGDLAIVSAQRDSWPEISGILIWRAVELAVGWGAGYDTIDQSCLTMLTHLPYLFFLTSFYRIRPTTAIICLSIDVVAIAAPFYLLRNILPLHRLLSQRPGVANRSVIDDFGVQLSTSLFATGVYGVVIYFSFCSWMPTYLVTHFDGIKDISSLYQSNFFWLCAAFVPTGIAAKTFLFTPATSIRPGYTSNGKASGKVTPFDPETATFGETLRWNLWGQSERVRILFLRTLVLASMVAIHTWLHTYLVVKGAEGMGAAGWSSIWSLAAILTGFGFWWISEVDGITN